MYEVMLPSLITGVVAIIVCVINNSVLHNKTEALISYRIQELERKVEKHNNVIERMTVAERDIKTAFKRIDEIRER